MTDAQLNEPDRPDVTGLEPEVPVSDAALADVPDDAFAADLASDPTPSDAADVAPQYGVGPFTIREVALGAVWLVAFVVSFFSLNSLGFESVWTRGIDWILMIGVPTVAVFLVGLRRLSPSGIRRVGSLGIDQFASVAFSVAAVTWLAQVWLQISVAINGGLWATTWVLWVELVLMLAGVVLTVFAPFIPVLEEDFQGRPDAPAHRNARPVRSVVARPARPVVAEPVAADTPAPFATDPGEPSTTVMDQSAWAAPAADAEPAPAAQAFWALVPEERDVVDEHGIPLFRIGPTAWALVIEDRGVVYVVRHEDGRVGYLHDVSRVTRG